MDKGLRLIFRLKVSRRGTRMGLCRDIPVVTMVTANNGKRSEEVQERGVINIERKKTSR